MPDPLAGTFDLEVIQYQSRRTTYRPWRPSTNWCAVFPLRLAYDGAWTRGGGTVPAREAFGYIG